jgi:hypothetical protein
MRRNAVLAEIEEVAWRALLHPRVPKGRRFGGQFVDVLGKLEQPAPRARGGRRRTPQYPSFEGEMLGIHQMQFEEGLEPGDKVDVHWTSSGNAYAVPATVQRVNKSSIAVTLDEPVHAWEFNKQASLTVPAGFSKGGVVYPEGRKIRVPRAVTGQGFSVNNGVFPRQEAREGRAKPAVATKAGMSLEQVRAKLKPGEKKVMGDLPDGTVIETPDGRVGILKPSEGKPTYGDKIYVVAYDVETGQQFEPPAVFPPMKSSSEPAVKKAAAALLDQAEPAPQAPQQDLGGGQLGQLLQQLGQAAAPTTAPSPGVKQAGGWADMPGDLSIAHPEEMEARVQEVAGILGSGKAKKDAVLDLIGPDPAREARIKALTSGDVDRALKEYKFTPVGDLAVLSGIDVRSTPIQGQAVCYMNDRSVAMGSTSAIGDFRHELGHAIRASLGGDGGPGKKTALSAYVAERHDETLAKAAEGQAKFPGGQQFPGGAEGNALKQAFYEENFGTIDPRSLDNWEEDFAEHYRAYQKAVYQAYITEGGAPDHDAGALEHYRATFPKWADFWDAWYTAQAGATA